MVYLKQRGDRLYRFNPEEMRLFGNAVQNARLNFWGPGDGIILEIEDQYGRPGLQYLTGIAASSINPIELGVRQTLTLDIAFSLWLALGSGSQPMIHPQKKIPYGWDEIFALLELNEDTASKWKDHGIVLKTFDQVLSQRTKARKSLVRSGEIDLNATWKPPADTNLTLKRRDFRLLKYDLTEVSCLGLAIRESRNQFFGPDKPLSMEMTDVLTGLGPSVLSRIERKTQNTITLDNIVTLLAAMGSGQAPPIHPLTNKPYDWDAIANLLILDEEIAARWEEQELVEAGFELKTIKDLIKMSDDAKKISDRLKTKNRGTHDRAEDTPNKKRNAKLVLK